jgi:putative PIN family toxin of toxin-antitoxin system
LVNLVLDTNIVLDLFVYEDVASEPLRKALADRQTNWMATEKMREELSRVLAYPQIAKRLTARRLPAEAVLAMFDGRARIVPVAPKAPYTCKDADDQCFIDLAAEHQTTLLSKDAEVLCMAKRLAKLGVTVLRALPATNTDVRTA